MTLSHSNPKFNAKTVLAACEHFANEKRAIQELVESRGHILRFSPKYHPEVAGCGIEYCWGKAKQAYRAKINTCQAKDLEENVRELLSAEVLPLVRVRRFARRARDYIAGYKKISEVGEDPERTGLDRIEFMRKLRTNILKMEAAFLQST